MSLSVFTGHCEEQSDEANPLSGAESSRSLALLGTGSAISSRLLRAFGPRNDKLKTPHKHSHIPKSKSIAPAPAPLRLGLGGPLTGLLLVLCYPSFSIAPLAWVAFLPLLNDLYYARSLREACLSAALAGAILFLGSCWWISYVSLAGCILLCGAYLCLFFVPFGAFVAYYYHKKQSIIFWGSVFWIASEFLRGNIMTGFPWNTLASSQAHVLPLIQMASVAGAYGVSFVVILVNLMLFEFWMWVQGRELKTSKVLMSFGVVLLGTVFVYGYRELALSAKAPVTDVQPIRLAAVQPNIAQEQKWDPAHREFIMSRLKELTREAAETKPALIVLPETCVPGELRNDPGLRKEVEELVRETGTCLLMGTQDSEPATDGRCKYYNGAVLVDPRRGLVEMYHKMHLVPFGEFLPLAKWFPILRRFIPIPEDFTAGTEETVFQMRGEKFSWKDSDGTIRSETELVRFAAVICFEDVFPELVRQFCAKNLDFIVNITNDAWFQKSGASVQHANLAIFRAVENRTHLLRATNTGYTCLVDPYGRIRAEVRRNGGIFVPGTIVADIVPLRKRSLYNQMGDFFAHACLILAIMKGFMMLREKEKRV